jgi:hypothetical protein
MTTLHDAVMTETGAIFRHVETGALGRVVWYEIDSLGGRKYVLGYAGNPRTDPIEPFRASTYPDADGVPVRYVEDLSLSIEQLREWVQA